MKYAIITTEFFNIDINPDVPIPLGSIVSYHDIGQWWSINYQRKTWTYAHEAIDQINGTLIKSYITFLNPNNKLVKLIFNLDKRNVLI